MVFKIFISTLLQLLYSVGAFVFVGFLIAWLNGIFYRLCGKSATKINRWTGVIGTPIHEFGHAFFCVLFRHKIHKIKLYDPHGAALGYVEHSYNPRSIYQRIGRFFVGVGPIPFGALALAVLLWALVPETFQAFQYRLNVFAASASGESFRFSLIVEAICGVFVDFFSPSNFANLHWWIYLILACFVALHVNLSRADIEGAIPGAVCFGVLIAVVNIVLGIVGVGVFNKYHSGFLQVCMFAFGAMLLCVFFCVLAIGIAFVVSTITKQIFRRR